MNVTPDRVATGEVKQEVEQEQGLQRNSVMDGSVTEPDQRQGGTH